MKTKDMTEIQAKASEWLKWFEWKERDNGDKFVTLKDGRPDELLEMVHKAHDDMGPDDHRYEFIENSLQSLVDYDDPDDIDSEMEPDIYNNDLLKWLGSNLTRAGYVDEAVEEFGIDAKGFDLYKVIGWGQLREKQEVLNIVRHAVEAAI